MSERIDLLERYAAEGQTLRARPGVAILSFWQGVFEIVYRIVALVSCIAVIIPSGLGVSRISATDELLVAPEVRATGLALNDLVVAAGTIGVTLELIVIILRFLNIGYVNLKINYFLLTDVLVDAGLIVLFITGGIGTIISAGQVWNVYANIPRTLSATCGVSFFCMGIFVGLMSYTISFVCNKWNNKVIAYTLSN